MFPNPIHASWISSISRNSSDDQSDLDLQETFSLYHSMVFEDLSPQIQNKHCFGQEIPNKSNYMLELALSSYLQEYTILLFHIHPTMHTTTIHAQSKVTPGRH